MSVYIPRYNRIYKNCIIDSNGDLYRLKIDNWSFFDLTVNVTIKKINLEYILIH